MDRFMKAGLQVMLTRPLANPLPPIRLAEPDNGDVVDLTQPRYLFRALAYSITYIEPVDDVDDDDSNVSVDDYNGGGYAVENIPAFLLDLCDRLWLLTTATVATIRGFINTPCNIDFLWDALRKQVRLRHDVDYLGIQYQRNLMEDRDLSQEAVAISNEILDLHDSVAMAPHHVHNVTFLANDLDRLRELLRAHNPLLSDAELVPSRCYRVLTMAELTDLCEQPVQHNPQPAFTLLNNTLGLTFVQFFQNHMQNYADSLSGHRALWQALRAAYEPLLTMQVEGLDALLPADMRANLRRELEEGDKLVAQAVVDLESLLVLYSKISTSLVVVQLFLLRKTIEAAGRI